MSETTPAKVTPSALESTYRAKCMNAAAAVTHIRSRDHLFCAQVASGPRDILYALDGLKQTSVKDVVLTTCLPLYDCPVFHDPEMKGILEHRSWFFNRFLMQAHREGLVSMIPNHSTTMLPKTLTRAKAEGRRPVLLATASLPDEKGNLSLSISAMFERDLVDAGAYVIIEVNPNFPRTFGDTLIHLDEVDCIVESDYPVPEPPASKPGAIDVAIAGKVASLIEDGATLQLGFGSIPDIVARQLKDRKNLGIHTEMFTESMIDLIECGAVDNHHKGFLDGYSVCAFTFGSRRLYDYVDQNPAVLFKSCQFTNSSEIIGRNKQFVSVNAALEVDLTGQCSAESIGLTQFSGSGGQEDTVRGAQRSPGGKSILAMHSTFMEKQADGSRKMASKIVPFFKPGTAVTTSRNEVDYIVTEYGIAWLRGLTIAKRCQALIEIAHPAFREELQHTAKKSGLLI